MSLVILASLFALILVIAIAVKRQAKDRKALENEFWAREHRANFVRNKPLDDLKYIKIPLETFPTHVMNDDPTVLECIDILETLTSQKIVNLTGWSNTDLKLEYGTGNISVLSEYDQNYTVLVRTLQKWADVLIEAGHLEDAVVLMEFAVGTGTDIGRTYYHLADYWNAEGEWAQVDRLIQSAGQLRSSHKDTIIKNLKTHNILNMQ